MKITNKNIGLVSFIILLILFSISVYTFGMPEVNNDNISLIICYIKICNVIMLFILLSVIGNYILPPLVAAIGLIIFGPFIFITDFFEKCRDGKINFEIDLFKIFKRKE